MGDSGIRMGDVPPLHLPVLYAAWPGMGNVALNAARFLVDSLEMEQIASIESPEFSFGEGIVIRDHIVLPLETPEYRFYAYRNPGDRGDLVVFTGDHQPYHPHGLLLSRLVLDVANRLGVRRVYTGAALACSISHMEFPSVWGGATHREILPELEALQIRLLEEGHVSGMNGLLLGVAKQMGLEGVCLLGELPYYTIGIDNPKASLAILEKLSLLWGIPFDTSSMNEECLRKEIEIEEFIRQGDGKILLDESVLKGAVRDDGGGHSDTPQ